MLCLEVSLNHKRLCLAGIANGVTNLGIMTVNPGPFEVAPTLRVDGVQGEGPFCESVEWVSQELALGDLVAFRLVEAENPDPPHPIPLEEQKRLDAEILGHAQEDYAELRGRLKELEARWGEHLVKSPDA